MIATFAVRGSSCTRSFVHANGLTTAACTGQHSGMPRLVRLDTGVEIGDISDQQLAFLVEQLEEENDEDKDYFVDKETLELLADNGCDPELLAMLEKAIGQDDAMDIVWE
jgi:processive 1,2-diacylglycerol beta-glucosyltransferase